MIFVKDALYITIDGWKTIVKCTATSTDLTPYFAGTVISTNNGSPLVVVGQNKSNWNKNNFIGYDVNDPDSPDIPDIPTVAQVYDNIYIITAGFPLLEDGLTIETSVSEDLVVDTVSVILDMINEISQ